MEPSQNSFRKLSSLRRKYLDTVVERDRCGQKVHDLYKELLCGNELVISSVEEFEVLKSMKMFRGIVYFLYDTAVTKNDIEIYTGTSPFVRVIEGVALAKTQDDSKPADLFYD